MIKKIVLMIAVTAIASGCTTVATKPTQSDSRASDLRMMREAHESLFHSRSH